MLRQLSNNNGFDIIHDTDLWMPFNHTIAKHAYQSRIPRVVSPRGSLEPWALSYRSWKKKIAFKLYQKRDLERAALLHATSQQEQESFRRVGLKQPVAVIPNGINIPELSASPEQSKVNQVLYLSRIHPIKGLLNLVSAWAVTRPKGWRLIIAGPDEDGYQKIVEEAIRREGIEDIVTFCGRVQGKHKESLYRKSKLFVLPSFSENFGNVIAEALSYGLPVITTKGTPWKNLTKYNCGWWVDIGVEALADAIRKATSLTDQELNEMGIRGRHYIVNNFAMPKITEQMYGTYKWLLGRGEKPSCIEM
jgi:glycosyltransferase involved in cell wall biosynthesis